MADDNEKIRNFMDIAGVTEERARFYIEASGGDVQLALQGFFEHDGDDGAIGVPPNVVAEDSDTEVDRTGPPPAVAPSAFQAVMKPKPKPPPPGPRTGMATLDSLKREEEEAAAMDSSDEDSDEEKGQAFYAGGGQHSGQQILGPPKKKDVVAEMFKKARERGAEEVSTTFAEINVQGHQHAKKGGFSGVGYTLGDTPESSSSTAVNLPPSAQADPNRPREVTLRLWANGFTVDDGPLREFHDPVNAAFLSSVKNGEVPRELIRTHGGVELSLSMIDKRMEEYAPPKASSRAFTGTGQMLGSPAPAVVGSVMVNPSEADKAANERAAREALSLNEGAPTTNIQLRLTDGTRLVSRFNHTHTVRDLYTFINTARPQFNSVNYVLVLFPNTEMNDYEKTLSDANLLNSSLVQKIKQ